MADITTEAASVSRPEEGARDRGGLTRKLRYFGGKLAGAAISLLAVICTAFFLFRILPNDPVRTMTKGRPMTPEQMAAMRRSFGLDKPISEQFLDYLAGVVKLDFGNSLQYSRPVTELIGDRIWSTVLLVGTAVVISAVIGLKLGVSGAWNHGSTSDRVNTGVALTLWSVPSFWLGLILIVLFSSGLGWFPTSGMKSPNLSGLDEIVDIAHHMVLPVLTLVAVFYAQYLLIMRSSLLDEMGNDYLTTARAKGLRDAAVRRRHGVPNAMLPTVTLLFINLGFVVFGAVLVETIFSWPGLGYLFYEGLYVPDLPLVQGLFIVFSASVILMNLLADLFYPIIDPRVRP